MQPTSEDYANLMYAIGTDFAALEGRSAQDVLTELGLNTPLNIRIIDEAGSLGDVNSWAGLVKRLRDIAIVRADEEIASLEKTIESQREDVKRAQEKAKADNLARIAAAAEHKKQFLPPPRSAAKHYHDFFKGETAESGTLFVVYEQVDEHGNVVPGLTGVMPRDNYDGWDKVRATPAGGLHLGHRNEKGFYVGKEIGTFKGRGRKPRRRNYPFL